MKPYICLSKDFIARNPCSGKYTQTYELKNFIPPRTVHYGTHLK